MRWYFVYILASKKRGVLYIGMTSDLEGRMYQHKNNELDGFTKNYRVHRLVYYEEYEDVWAAIDRERSTKKWRRDWKIKLIEKHNPEWLDLCTEDGDILPLPQR